MEPFPRNNPSVPENHYMWWTVFILTDPEMNDCMRKQPITHIQFLTSQSDRQSDRRTKNANEVVRVTSMAFHFMNPFSPITRIGLVPFISFSLASNEDVLHIFCFGVTISLWQINVLNSYGFHSATGLLGNTEQWGVCGIYIYNPTTPNTVADKLWPVNMN